MTKRKLLLLIGIFLLYELLVWAGAVALLPDNFLLVGFVLTVCGLTVLLVYILVARLSQAQRAPQAAAEGAPQPAAPPSVRDEQSDAISNLIREANERLSKSPKLAAQKRKR